MVVQCSTGGVIGRDAFKYLGTVYLWETREKHGPNDPLHVLVLVSMLTISQIKNTKKCRFSFPKNFSRASGLITMDANCTLAKTTCKLQTTITRIAEALVAKNGVIATKINAVNDDITWRMR